MKKPKRIAPRPTPVPSKVDGLGPLSTRLGDLERECRSLTERCLALEARAARLWKLYVASHRLHEPADKQGVIEVIQEIVSAIIGSEAMAILEQRADGQLEVSAAFGVEPAKVLWHAHSDHSVSRALELGESFVARAPQPGGKLTACIPLKVGGDVKAVLVVFELLAHKPAYVEEDHVVFELLSLQAGPALQCAKGGPG